MNTVVVKRLGLQDYQPVWQQMQDFTSARTYETPDELWLLEHPAVFTLGQQGERGQLLQATDIPVIQTDRGGHVTYHGPGQLIVYPLLDLRRRHLSIRPLVSMLERTLIELLNQFDIDAYARSDAPGVYVKDAKIASLGLRVRKGCCYHGLALNVKMDLTPFSLINPCGMPNLPMTQISDFVPEISIESISLNLTNIFLKYLLPFRS